MGPTDKANRRNELGAGMARRRRAGRRRLDRRSHPGDGRWRVDGRLFELSSEPTRNGKDFGMVRLRNALMALMLATAVVGCAHNHGYARWSIFHCTECD